LSYLTVNKKWEIGRGISSWSYRLSSELSIYIIKITNLLKSYFNLSVDFLKLFFREWCFHNFLLFHENLRKYLIHINTRNFIELALIYHCNKVIHLLRIPKTSRPYFKFHMFIFNFFYHICKENLHLILHWTELRDFCIWIFIENILNFTPFHFLAALVEQSTFLTIVQTILADESWFTALRVNTYHETEVTIYALWTCFEMFRCHLKILFWLSALVN